MLFFLTFNKSHIHCNGDEHEMSDIVFLSTGIRYYSCKDNSKELKLCPIKIVLTPYMKISGQSIK